MKKLFSRKKATSDAPAPTRITNETVAEHRERILAGGRKFKYPLQYAKHKLVINTIVILLVALAVLSTLSYIQLYQMQTTNIFFYRLAQIIPVPVASVDGSQSRYADYLLYYRSSEHYLLKYDNVKPDSQNGKRQLDYIKRETMNNVIADTYAEKIAKQHNITVTDKEVSDVIERDKNTQDGKISQEAYDASALRILNWSPEEYRLVVKKRLLLQKVSYFIDSNAMKKQQAAARLVAAPNSQFASIATSLADDTSKVLVGASGLVKMTGSFGGISEQAAKLQKGQVSGVLKSNNGDGYYYIRLIDKTDTQVNFEFIQIPLTQFASELKKLKDDHKIKEFIKIPEQTQTNEVGK